MTVNTNFFQIELANDSGVDQIPETWGNDCEGRVTIDPKSVLSGGGLQPLGGQEETGNYSAFLFIKFSFFVDQRSTGK